MRKASQLLLSSFTHKIAKPQSNHMDFPKFMQLVSGRTKVQIGSSAFKYRHSNFPRGK